MTTNQLTTGANKAGAAHGGGVRGSDLSHRSSQLEGRFGPRVPLATAGTLAGRGIADAGRSDDGASRGHQ